jgi:hypothetical protein
LIWLPQLESRADEIGWLDWDALKE